MTSRRAVQSRLLGPAPRDLRGRVFRGADGRDYVALWFSRQPDRWAGLSGAEREVAGMILAGFSNEAISAARRVAKATVATQVRSVFAKVGVASRAELVGRLIDAPRYKMTMASTEPSMLPKLGARGNGARDSGSLASGVGGPQHRRRRAGGGTDRCSRMSGG